MTLYFAYGSNLNREQMLRRCPEHRVVGLGVLRDYRWLITRRGYASVVPSPGDEVHGLLYKISPSDERELDIYEAVAEGMYLKETLPIKTADGEQACMVYVDPVTEEGRPSTTYAQCILTGIRDANLPVEYVERYLQRFLSGSQ